MGKSKRPHDTAMQCSVQRETLTLGFRKTQPLQTEYAKSAFETFMAESQKIGALYRDLAVQSYKPFGGFLAKMTPANR